MWDGKWKNLELPWHPFPPERAWQQQWQDGIPSRAILFKEECPAHIPSVAFAKIMRKIMFDFLLTLNSNKTLHSLCSLFLFGRKIRGEMLTEIKKALKPGKNKYCAILLGSHVPLTCLPAYKHVHAHTIHSLYIVYLYINLCIFDMYFQNLAFNTIWVIVRLERWKICKFNQKHSNIPQMPFYCWLNI